MSRLFIDINLISLAGNCLGMSEIKTPLPYVAAINLASSSLIAKSRTCVLGKPLSNTSHSVTLSLIKYTPKEVPK